MKKLLVISALLIGSCRTTHKVTGSKQTVIVDAIKRDEIPNHYVIQFHFVGLNQNGSLISKIGNEDCHRQLVTGHEYELELERLTSTEEITETSFRLNENNIYIDGKLVFPKDQQFYTSESINGICVN